MKDFSITYFPSKTEKNHSNSPATLIDRMHLPTLIVQGNSIKTGTGKTATIFINGERYSEIEHATFWPKQVKKIEYIEQSDNPKYLNYLPIVNFIMDEYVWGNITKLEGTQTMPNSGFYRGSTKFSNNNIILTGLISHNYIRLHSLGEEGHEYYPDLSYQDSYYNDITKNYSTSQYSRLHNTIAALGLKYKNEKISISHVISYSDNRNPGSESNSKEDWQNFTALSSASNIITCSKARMPSITGSYSIDLSNSSNLAIDWTYKYVNNKNFTSYNSTLPSDFYNEINENGNIVSFEASYAKIINKFQIGADLSLSYEHYHDKYLGETADSFKTWQTSGSVRLNFTWRISRKFGLDLHPALTNNNYRSGDNLINRHWIPSASATLSFTDGRQFMAGLDTYYYRFSPSSSELSNVIIKINELMWLQGNPRLKPAETWAIRVNGMWLGNQFLTLSTNIMWQLEHNHANIIYRNNNINNQGGLVQQYINLTTAHLLTWTVIGRLRLGRVSVWAQPTLTYQKATGESSAHLVNPRVLAGADYSLKNFLFSAYYDTRYKVLSDGGRNKSTLPAKYNFEISYSNGDFQASIRGINLFEKRKVTTEDYHSPVFVYNRKSWNPGRSMEIAITYTFGGGKKLDRYIDIQTPGSIESGILGQ
ncbi:MAG: outer membrane beta-barrel family protein [Muribaculaceae bacterium]|nr:outer membrane beta-barrel family protein [Muribaculaceae bacterium]